MVDHLRLLRNSPQTRHEIESDLNLDHERDLELRMLVEENLDAWEFGDLIAFFEQLDTEQFMKLKAYWDARGGFGLQ